MIAIQDIFLFDRTGIDESGKVRGHFRATGIRPKFAERLATAGCALAPALIRIEGWRFRVRYLCSPTRHSRLRGRGLRRFRRFLAASISAARSPPDQGPPGERAQGAGTAARRRTRSCCATSNSAAFPLSTPCCAARPASPTCRKCCRKPAWTSAPAIFSALRARGVVARRRRLRVQQRIEFGLDWPAGRLHPSVFIRLATGATSASKNLKNYFPKPSTRWLARSAPDTLSPPHWK